MSVSCVCCESVCVCVCVCVCVYNCVLLRNVNNEATKTTQKR